VPAIEKAMISGTPFSGKLNTFRAKISVQIRNIIPNTHRVPILFIRFVNPLNSLTGRPAKDSPSDVLPVSAGEFIVVLP
jgi:hypothetical protein